jgi:hypothetical protein
LLQCAHQIEEDLGYPNSTKWYLAADDFKVYSDPRVRSWHESGKLVWANASAPIHVAKAHLDLDKAASGTLWAWVDYLVLSQADAVVCSSSGFGVTAAQIGAVPWTYTHNGCALMDLTD